jgi:arylsulfatase A-like enzyme
MAYNTARNTPLRGAKAQTLEGGIRVPFFISWAGKLPAGKVYDQPVIALDVLPTVLTRADVPVPADCDGVNLFPHLTGENSGAPHEALYWRFGPQKAIRRGPWKLVDWRDFATDKSSGWQLYDLSTDLGEQHDLAESHPELVGDLVRSWDEWDAKNVAPRWRGDRHEDPPAARGR